MRRLLQPDALRYWNQPIHAQLRHRFVGRLNRARIQLYPARIGQFHEPARRALQPLQICRAQLQPFLLPFRRHRQPIYPASFDHQARA